MFRQGFLVGGVVRSANSLWTPDVERDKLTTTIDGSVDLYSGPKTPDGTAANRTQTIPSKGQAKPNGGQNAPAPEPDCGSLGFRSARRSMDIIDAHSISIRALSEAANIAHRSNSNETRVRLLFRERQFWHLRYWDATAEDRSYCRSKWSVWIDDSTPDKTERWAYERTKVEIGEVAGLLCFSKEWRNPAQCSQYADRHWGLCLGFDLPDELVIAVIYRRLPRRADEIPRDAPFEERWLAYKRVMSTKFTHWSYEREMRMFERISDVNRDGDHHFRSFDDDFVLRQMIVGHRSTVERSTLNRALGDLAEHVEAFKARLCL
jgi:hypothetical protein